MHIERQKLIAILEQLSVMVDDEAIDQYLSLVAVDGVESQTADSLLKTIAPANMETIKEFLITTNIEQTDTYLEHEEIQQMIMGDMSEVQPGIMHIEPSYMFADSVELLPFSVGFAENKEGEGERSRHNQEKEEQAEKVQLLFENTTTLIIQEEQNIVQVKAEQTKEGNYIISEINSIERENEVINADLNDVENKLQNVAQKDQKEKIDGEDGQDEQAIGKQEKTTNNVKTPINISKKALKRKLNQLKKQNVPKVGKKQEIIFESAEPQHKQEQAQRQQKQQNLKAPKMKQIVKQQTKTEQPIVAEMKSSSLKPQHPLARLPAVPVKIDFYTRQMDERNKETNIFFTDYGSSLEFARWEIIVMLIYKDEIKEMKMTIPNRGTTLITSTYFKYDKNYVSRFYLNLTEQELKTSEFKIVYESFWLNLNERKIQILNIKSHLHLYRGKAIYIEDKTEQPFFKKIMASNFHLFLNIPFIIKKTQLNNSSIQQKLRWLKLIRDIYNSGMNESNEKIVFTNLKSEIAQPEISQYVVYLLYSIFKDESEAKMFEYQWIKSMTISMAYDMRTYQKSKHFKSIQLFYFKMLLYNKLNTFNYQSINDALKLNFKYQAESQIRDIIFKLSQTYPQILGRQNDLVTIQLEKQIFSLEDWLIIKIKYASHAVYISFSNSSTLYQGSMHDNIILGWFLNDLKNKLIKLPQQSRNSNFDFSKMKDSIRRIFIKTQNWSKDIFRISNNRFTQMYISLKELLFYYPKFADYIMNMIAASANYNELLNIHGTNLALAMLVKPFLQPEYQVLCHFFKTYKFNNGDIIMLFRRIYYSTENISVDLFKDLLQMFISTNNKSTFEIYALFPFMNQIFDKKEEKNRIMYDLFHFALKETIIPIDNNISKYVQTIFSLKDLELRVAFSRQICNQIRRQLPREEQFYEIINKAAHHDKQKRDYIISLYFGEEEKAQDDIQKKVWECLITNIDYISCLRTRFKANFDLVIQRIAKNIEEDKIVWADLETLQHNKQKIIKKYIGHDLVKAIEKSNIKMQDYYQKLKIIIDVTAKCLYLSEFHHYFVQKEGQLKLLPFFQTYVAKFGENEEWMLRHSKELKTLVSYQFSQIHSANTIDELQTLFESERCSIYKELQNLKADKLEYLMLKKYFPPHLVSSIGECFCASVKEKQTISRIAHKVNLQYIIALNNYIQAFTYILVLLKKDDEQPRFIKLRDLKDKALNEDNLINLIESVTLIEEVEEILCQIFQIRLDSKNPENSLKMFEHNQKLAVIASTFKSKQLFQLIEARKIDHKCIGDLKEYINDQEHCSLGMDSLKQLETVIDYWNLIQKSSIIKLFFRELEKKIEKSKGQLREHLDKSASILRLIEQKLDEAANRQTSFKYQIQSIFNYSTLVIKPIADNIEIQVKASLKSMNKFTSQKDWLIVSYKKLELFKEKSILLVSDIERQQNPDINTINTLQIFKKYEKYFVLVEKIYNLSLQLVSYGYNIKFLSQSTVIVKDCDFQNLQEEQQKWQKIATDWIEGIKHLYQKSYLLTHYIGPQLSLFIDRCLNNTYHPSLKAIFSLSEAEFREAVLKEQFSDLIARAKKEEPQSQIKLIIQAYSSFQVFHQSEISQPQSITIHNIQPKYFYCCLLEQLKNIASSTRVLYCLESTKGEEIEVFLWRALIDNEKPYYFVGAHNLKEEIRLHFCDLLMNLLENYKYRLEKAKFHFIDCYISDKLYALLTRSKFFNILKKEYLEIELQNKTIKLINSLPQTWIVDSQRASLGKTYVINQMAKDSKKEIKFLTLAGNIDFSKLGRRLKQLELSENDCLCLSIHDVQNWQKVQVFLSELILFRCFYCEQYIFLPDKLPIYVQIENFYRQSKEQIYPLLDLFKKYKKGIHIDKFEVDKICIDENNEKDKFVLLYLDMLDQQGLLNRKQLYLHEIALFKLPAHSHRLIDKYFMKWFKDKNQEPTFRIYKAFMKMTFNAFFAFSQCVQLKIEFVGAQHAQYQVLELIKVRETFIKVCIQNSLQFLQQTFSSNDFSFNHLHDTFSSTMKEINMLILPVVSGVYQFVYAQDRNVPTCIKSILLAQNNLFFAEISRITSINEVNSIFMRTSLNFLKGQQLEKRLHQILVSIAQLNLSDLIPAQFLQDVEFKVSFEDYKLTLDNFIKMCLIWHRTRSGIPCIIMGESGVGKTKLVSFLVKEVLKNDLLTFNLHAGIHEQDLTKWVTQIREKAQTSSEKVWVFFDEFNTCDEVGYIKEIVIDHRFMGKPLPDNVIMLAACNPYRKKRMAKLIKAGITRQNIQDNQLAFKVKAPPLSMVQLMWDYQQIKQAQNRIYIQKMLQKLNYSKKDAIINCIVAAHEYLKDNVEISAVSLRDVERFKKIFNWFIKYMPQHAERQQISAIDYKMDRGLRAVLLTYSFCYCLRLSAGKERDYLYNIVETELMLNRGDMKRIVVAEQTDYVRRLKTPDEDIALNNALIEYVFGSLVCLLNKIPVLLIGNPGSSKSLSMKLIQSNLRGKSSPSEFCQQFPEFNVLYFQGSQSSTSKGVEQIFDKALRWKKEGNQKWKIQQCILFDEIGLAQKSVHNPLKVLHAKLQNPSDQICFIGISNWQLDLAKLSRFLIIAKSTPDIKDLSETALQIANSCLGDHQTRYLTYQVNQQNWEQLGRYYYRFIEIWERQNNRANFFGLRDFYGYVKYICKAVQEGKGQLGVFQKAIERSIEINFDGQPKSVALFRKIAGLKPETIMRPLQMISQNLSRVASRCLLLIVKGDSLVPLINNSINMNEVDRKIICIHGSTFAQDQQSEEYNLEMTSLIIAHVSRGNVLAFKDINNSIQTSLYDLFNKSFTRVGLKRYCRIAVGANSNPKCLVHHNFNAIVYVEQSRLSSLDPPFLNRFQKHYLNIQNMASKQQLHDLQQIQKWIQNILSHKSKDSLLKNQQYLINTCKQALITLIIKYRNSNNRVEAIKRDLRNCQTTDFMIAFRNQQELKEEIDEDLLSERLSSTKKADIIIYTYEQFMGLTEQSILPKGYFIHLQQITSEKQLRRQIKSGLLSSEENVQIIISYQNHHKHISFLLFLAIELKTSLNCSKQIIVILQMHRFSLQQLKIDHFNISYLHPFKQLFMESLNRKALTQMQRLLKTDNYWEMFNILEMKNDFVSLLTDTLKFTRFVSKKNKNESLQGLYFNESLQLASVFQFALINLRSIEALLSAKKMDLKIIQTNNEDLVSCSNILESIGKQIEDKCKEIIYEHLKAVVEKNLLFSLTLQKNSSNIHNLTSIFTSYYFNNIKHIKQMAYAQLEKQQKSIKQKNSFNFKRRVEENIIVINEQILLLPVSIDDFELIFIGGEQTIEGTALKIGLRKDEQLSRELYLEYCQQLFRKRSRMSQIGYLDHLQSNYELQALYLYDIITYLRNQNNRSAYKVEQIVLSILQIFKSCSIIDKLIILTIDRTLTLLLLDLLEGLSQYPIILRQILADIKWTDNQHWGQTFAQLVQKLIMKCKDVLNKPHESLKIIKNIKNMFNFQNKIYRIINNIHASYSDFGIHCHQQIELNHKFLELLSNFKDELATQILRRHDQQKKQNTHFSACYCIYRILRELLKNQSLKIQELILSYLSYNIFYLWIIQTKQKYHQQLSECLKAYIQLSNMYPIVANHSTPFLQELFYIPYLQSLAALFHHCERLYMKELENGLTLNNNISVAIGFYLSKMIHQISNRQFEAKGQPTSSAQFIKHYQVLFDKAFEKEVNFNFQQILIIQFSKIYSLHYLEQLEKYKENPQLLEKIDRLLSIETNHSKHIKLFLLKHLTQKYGSLQKVKRRFIEVKRCSWILSLAELIEDQKMEILMPLTLKSQLMEDLIHKFDKSKYTDMQFFHDMILEGLNSPINTHIMLTYFLCTFYMRNCPEYYIPLLIKEVEGREDLKQRANKPVKELILMYLKHSVNHKIMFRSGENQDQTMRYIPLLNYVNVLASCRRVKQSLIGIFFQQNGQICDNYDKWLENRHIPGTIENPSYSRIEYILKRDNEGFSSKAYLLCSEKCSYVTPVGGHFYGEAQNLGCAVLDPGTTFRCPLCGIISTINENNQYEGKVIDRQMLLKERSLVAIAQSFIMAEKEETCEIRLKGYHHGSSLESLRISDSFKQELFGLITDHLEPIPQFTSYKILQSIIYFFWHVLAESSTLEHYHIDQVFNLSQHQFISFSFEAAINYFQSANQSILFKDAAEVSAWHFVLGKNLLEELCNQKQHQVQPDTLAAKRGFEEWLYRTVLDISGPKKQKIILNNRKLLLINKSEIIKEQGNVEKHMQEYPMIRMFKRIKSQLTPSIINMEQYSGETITQKYPLLAYLLNPVNKAKFINFANIFHFITTLISLNLKLSRSDGSQPIHIIVEQYFNATEEEKGKVIDEMLSFIESWNNLVKLKYRLKDGCTELGFLDVISEKTPVRNFLIEKNNQHNIECKRTIELLVTAANQYNELCEVLQNLGSKSNLQFMSEIKMNPTSFVSSSFMNTPTAQIEEAVKIYSNFSVQYGLSNPQYLLEQIQTMASKCLNGKKFLHADKQLFNYVSYIGEDSTFMLFIREDSQLALSQSSEDRLEQYFKRQKLKRGETFYKFIKELIGSLENTIVAFKNKRKILSVTATIGEFINCYKFASKIRNFSKQLIEDPLQSISINSLGAVYELVESYTFDFIEELLNPIYKQPLNIDERQRINHMLMALKKVSADMKDRIPTLPIFKQVLNRFVSRSLMMQMANQKQPLSSHICDLYWLWPKSYNLQLLDPQFKQQLSRIAVSKTGEILKMINVLEKEEASNEEQFSKPNYNRNTQPRQKIGKQSSKKEEQKQPKKSILLKNKDKI